MLHELTQRRTAAPQTRLRHHPIIVFQPASADDVFPYTM
jgi:hypothetical protein